MADQKISELTAITGANTADDDLLVIVDTSASQTKKITLGELENALAERDFAFGDNDKLTFGAGSDLQIYHDGSDSFITDTGAGNLQIWGGNFRVRSSDGSEAVIDGNSGGAVTLYYDNAAKLATTSTGIDVTGNVTADGLTVDGNAKISAGSPTLRFTETDQTDLHTRMTAGGGSIYIQTENDAETVRKDRFRINHSTGDISFYEDTGTTAKFFWDASAESLGIGTTSPQRQLHLNIGTDNTAARFQSTDAEVSLEFIDTAGTAYFRASGDYIKMGATSSDSLTIDSSGNVGIGETSPQGKLHLKKTDTGNSPQNPAGNQLVIENGDSSGSADIQFLSASNGYNHIFFGDAADANIGVLLYDHTNNSMQFTTNTSEAMRIDSSGNLLVGATTTTNMSDGTGNDGIALNPAGTLVGARTSNVSMVLNRLSTDGAIANFNKDGTTVGSIGNRFGAMYVHSPDGTNGAGLRFFDGVIQPCESNGNDSDNDTDLGQTNSRFKDLYLSGRAYINNGIKLDAGDGIYFGQDGTAANKLDDYETGTFTPTAFGSAVQGTTTYSFQYGYYTKVGDICHVTIFVSWTAMTGSGNLEIGGLPFTVSSDTQYYSVASVLPSQLNWGGGTYLTALGKNGVSRIAIYYAGDDANAATQAVVNETANLRISMSYKVA